MTRVRDVLRAMAPMLVALLVALLAFVGALLVIFAGPHP